jgi:hypothetical protein
VSKVIQNLAGDVPFGEKEPFMVVFNGFIENNRPSYEKFIESSTVCNPLPLIFVIKNMFVNLPTLAFQQYLQHDTKLDKSQN